MNLDYHVEIDKHFYSVQFRLLREEVEARIKAKTVEILHRGKLVATHMRSLREHRQTTLTEHMQSSHGATATGRMNGYCAKPHR